jgi:hypothetical protein
LLDRGQDLPLLADIGRDGERRPAGRLDFLGGRVNGAGKLGMGVGRLGSDDDIGAVARGAQCDREANAALAAGNEQRLAFEIGHSDLPS